MDEKKIIKRLNLIFFTVLVVEVIEIGVLGYIIDIMYGLMASVAIMLFIWVIGYFLMESIYDYLANILQEYLKIDRFINN